jgi:hypothetical protein
MIRSFHGSSLCLRCRFREKDAGTEEKFLLVNRCCRGDGCAMTGKACVGVLMVDAGYGLEVWLLDEVTLDGTDGSGGDDSASTNADASTFDSPPNALDLDVRLSTGAEVTREALKRLSTRLAG